jgi:hypothetical protein
VPHLVAGADPGHPDGQHNHADPDQVPGHQDQGATVSAFMTRSTASLRGISNAMPSTHNGAISNTELQSGVMTSPNAPGAPSPNTGHG